MPDNVRADLLSGKRGDLDQSSRSMPFHHRMDAEAGHGQAIAVDEQALIRAALPGAVLELLHCYRPQRTYPLLVAFAEDADGLGMPIDIGDSDRACLAGAGARVVEEQEQG